MQKTKPKIKPDKFRNQYRIPSARKRKWDYRSKAIYFITICTRNRLTYFGRIENGKMILSDTGQIATTYWFDIPKHFPFIELINFVVMPNHIHGLVEIRDNNIDNMVGNTVETLHATSLQRMPPQQRTNQFMAGISPKRGSLSSVLRSYKSAVTRYANRNNFEFGWQTRFHDHVIMNIDEFNRVNEYIINNPQKWHEDDMLVI